MGSAESHGAVDRDRPNDLDTDGCQDPNKTLNVFLDLIDDSLWDRSDGPPSQVRVRGNAKEILERRLYVGMVRTGGSSDDYRPELGKLVKRMQVLTDNGSGPLREEQVRGWLNGS